MLEPVLPPVSRWLGLDIATSRAGRAHDARRCLPVSSIAGLTSTITLASSSITSTSAPTPLGSSPVSTTEVTAISSSCTRAPGGLGIREIEGGSTGSGRPADSLKRTRGVGDGLEVDEASASDLVGLPVAH